MRQSRLTDTRIVVNEGIDAFAFLLIGCRAETAKERRHSEPPPRIIARLSFDYPHFSFTWFIWKSKTHWSGLEPTTQTRWLHDSFVIISNPPTSSHAKEKADKERRKEKARKEKKTSSTTNGSWIITCRGKHPNEACSVPGSRCINECTMDLFGRRRARECKSARRESGTSRVLIFPVRPRRRSNRNRKKDIFF